ncbi:MAG: HpcH/HpaI aldolase/citrate lyase family protein [Woeseia sp.]
MRRSFLFVPGDSRRKLEIAADTDADALIIDLEDSILPSRRPGARDTAAGFLASHGDRNVWVRINPLDTEDALNDLRSVMPAGPAGIVLPKPRGVKDAIQLAKSLDVFEQESGLPQGRTQIMPIATERPAELFRLHEYIGATPRLAALTWGAEDLSTALGASNSRDEEGDWLPPYQLARSLCLIAASAAVIPAIDTVFTDYKDTEGLTRYAERARRDGFSGMLAIHPDQVDPINDAFMPSNKEIDRAKRIVELFAENPEAGTLGMDGEMIDRPHWVQAKRILDIAEQKNKVTR